MGWMDTLETIRTKDFSKVKPKEREQAARDVVNMASYACAIVAVSPIPFSDAVFSLPVQTAMVVTLGHIYGRKLTEAKAGALVLELGAVAGMGMVARAGIKALLPVMGALLTVPAAYAANWGIGRVAMEYFANDGIDKARMKEVFAKAKAEGKSMFSREGFERFRKSYGASVTEKPKAAPKKKKAAKKKVAAAPPAAE